MLDEMYIGCYAFWMLCFWMLRILAVMLLDVMHVGCDVFWV